MSDKRVSMLLAGVGGQGLLTAARVLGDAAHAAGQGVVIGQLHGLSQRGGSMECSVLFGPGQSSYLIRADLVIGFEPLETLRTLHRMGPETKLLINQGQFVLPDLIRLGKRYPPLEQIVAEIRAVVKEMVMVDGTGAMEKVGRMRTLNIFMLGALMELGWLPFDGSTLWPAVARQCKPDYLDANRIAFDLGRKSVVDGTAEKNLDSR